jgi:type I site-specific restriction endonuclease
VEQLNFPEFSFRIQDVGQKKSIFDPVRKKFIPLTPEEWVRQHCLQTLHAIHGLPFQRIAVERGLKVAGLEKRFDIVAFDRQGKPLVLVECKAPEVPIKPQTLLQILGYNYSLQCPWLWITNGRDHHWAQCKDENCQPCGFPKDLELPGVQ